MPAAEFLARTLTLGSEQHRYHVFVPPRPPRDECPVVLFLHGAGEGGIDGEAQTRVGLGRAIARDPERFPAVVVFPQARRGLPWRGAMADVAMRALEAAEAEFGGDPDRVYLTGVSMGGYGTWRLALEHPTRFAALAPVCGGLDSPSRRGAVPGSARPWEDAARALRHVPAWVFHGDADEIIPVEESRAMVEALRRGGADVRYTEYPGVGHDSWTPAYAEPELVPWMLAQRRRGFARA